MFVFALFMISVLPKITTLWLHIKVLKGSFSIILMMKAAGNTGVMYFYERREVRKRPVIGNNRHYGVDVMDALFHRRQRGGRQEKKLDFMAFSAG